MNKMLILIIILMVFFSDALCQERTRVIRNDCKCLDTLHNKMDSIFREVVGMERYDEFCKSQKKVKILVRIDTTMQVEPKEIFSRSLLDREEINKLYDYIGSIRQKLCECSSDLPEIIFIDKEKNYSINVSVPLPKCVK